MFLLTFQARDLLFRRKVFLTPVYHTLMYHRYKYYDFTVGYVYVFYCYSMAKPQILPNWLSLSHPMKTMVWGYVIIVLLIVPTILHQVIDDVRL